MAEFLELFRRLKGKCLTSQSAGCILNSRKP
jgi:hypothetical protein